MEIAALPENERARLDKLRQYKILDTIPEEAFDSITRLLATILDVPIALVSLVDSDRQWFKSKVGLDEDETSRDIAFCSHAILDQKVFVVPDTSEDPRFADNPLVLDGPSIRFYAGAPLTTSDGYNLGTLCGIDQKPREMTELQLQQLEDLARIVVTALELNLARAKADSAERARSEFLSTMSHEIRTPLNGILGLTQLLSHTQLDDFQRQQTDTILSSGQTLQAIINDVLDMNKIDAGSIELEDHVFSLGKFVPTILTTFQNLAEVKGLEIILDNQEEDLLIKGDSVRLHQILWNLVSNAIKFTNKGSVTLTVSKAEDGPSRVTEVRDHVLHFSVKDTGSGVASDRLETIFESFTQEDNSITRKHGGTGLGLTIVKKLTELMGGSVQLTSRPGEGAVFDIYLPFYSVTAEEAEKFYSLNSNTVFEKTGILKVLLAEDNPVNAMIATAFLENLGHTVRHVQNGLLAVEAAQQDWADLILMDVHMPEMDGVEATRIIRDTEIGKNLPIIGLTADAFVDHHQEFRKAGMATVLTKPYTEVQLANTLAAYGLREPQIVKHTN